MEQASLSCLQNFEKLPGSQDFDLLKRAKAQQVFVAADDEVGVARNCAFKHAIVVLVVGDGVKNEVGMNDDRILAEQVENPHRLGGRDRKLSAQLFVEFIEQCARSHQRERARERKINKSSRQSPKEKS